MIQSVKGLQKPTLVMVLNLNIGIMLCNLQSSYEDTCVEAIQKEITSQTSGIAIRKWELCTET